MILYLGTSSLIKLYAQEEGSEVVRAWVRSSEFVATCRIAYTEVISALNIRHRKGDLTKDDYDLALKTFIEDWESYVKVDFDDFQAGDFAMKYDLTRLSAIHLSSAKLLLNEYEKYKQPYGLHYNGGHFITVFFSSVDHSLCNAALNEGLTILSLE